MVSSGSRTHRRNSSTWVPEKGFDVPNPFESFRGKHRADKSRVILPNHLSDEEKYRNLPNYKCFKSNSISTTKYSLLTFIPANIFHQLKTRYANLYFLFIAALNWCPLLNVYSKWLSIIPPSIVMGTTMLKDGYEDYRRWKFDKEINSRYCHVWDKNTQRFRKTQWKYILVGDTVHVSNDQDIPADLLFIRSSNEEGTCFVETANLDGETSLKQRHVPHRILHFSGEDSGFLPSDFTGSLRCEKPDKAIYTVTASIELEPGMEEPIVKENMLLRGSKLKNTTFVEGVVMYTGHDTKVMMNNGRAPHKISAIEKLTNRFIIFCVILLALMVIFHAIMAVVILSKRWTDGHPDVPYIPSNIQPPPLWGALAMLFFIICYQVLVPISLYIIVELIKLGQIFFIQQDQELYDAESDYGINCRSLNIPEELGQISHVLSDKTGTLTENKMIFRNCAIGEADYGGEVEPDNLDPVNPVVSPTLQVRVQQEWQSDDRLRHFFMNIVVNNSVVVSKRPHKDAIGGPFDGQNDVYTIGKASLYDVSSTQHSKKQNELKEREVQIQLPADEATAERLVGSDATRDEISASDSNVGTMVSRVSSSFFKAVKNNVVKPIVDPIQSILSPGPTHDIKTSEFPNNFCLYEAESPDEMALIQGAELYNFRLIDRTGTHVTISRPDGNKEKIPLKIVFPFDSQRKRMSVIVQTDRDFTMYTKGADIAIIPRIIEGSDEHIRIVEGYLHKYACKGLRTLVFGMRKLSQDEFDRLLKSYRQVQIDTAAGRENLLSQLADYYEHDLTLLGVTGVEDRLQDGVETTIVSMKEAGMQLWILTGDKLETAENIARSCGLFSENTPVLRIRGLDDVVEDEELGCNLVLAPEAVTLVREGNEAIIKTLYKCSSVLCYRMTPSEKAEIVTAVRKYLKGKVLAIGDGANDVPMIQAAHVGIGIKGKEGMQAVMACDYAISRFRFLRKLLLVHGHWCYDRLALSFLYFLYKNANNVFYVFFYQFLSLYSGKYAMDPTYSLLYPIIFTALQPILVGVFDQAYSKEELLEKPEKYRVGIEGSLYTNCLYFLNVADGIWQAAVVIFFVQWTKMDSDCGGWTYGYFAATGMMLVNSLHLALEVRYWPAFLLVIFVFFFLAHFAYFFIISWMSVPGMVPDTPTHVAVGASADPTFWFCQLIIVIVSLLPRFLIRVTANSGINLNVIAYCIISKKK